MIDKWKKAVDNNKVFGTVLTDLSKAFDCICHDLLIAKLNAYGLSWPALKLIKDYLQNRKQRTYRDINSGNPHGSILGPVLFNIFFVTYFLKIKTITLQIMLMMPPHTLLVAQQQKF